MNLQIKDKKNICRDLHNTRKGVQSSDRMLKCLYPDKIRGYRHYFYAEIQHLHAAGKRGYTNEEKNLQHGCSRPSWFPPCFFSVSGCGSRQAEEASKKTEAAAETKKDSPSDKDTKEENTEAPKSTVKILDGKGITLNNGENNAGTPQSYGEPSQETEVPAESAETEVPGSTQTGPQEIPDPLAGTEERRDLTAEELDAFSAFVSDMENYGFLCSTYSVPQEVDLDQVLYTGAGMSSEPLTFEESAALQAAEGEPVFTDVTHLTSQQIEDFLQRKMGISLSEAAA